MHWTDTYIQNGFYDSDTSNCGHLIERVQKEVFNRDVDFVVPKETDSYEHIKEEINKQRDKCEQVDTPQEGDLVLLNNHGEAVHIGIVWFHGRKQYILHAMDRKKSVANTDIEALKRFGMSVEGYYRPICKENNNNNESVNAQSESTVIG